MISCASNVKQIGLAFHFYANDYDDVICPPWSGGGGAGSQEEPRWFQIFDNSGYLTRDLYHCPGNTNGFAYMPHNLHYGYIYMRLYHDFVSGVGWSVNPKKKLSRLKRPSEQMMITDSNGDNIWDCFVRRSGVATEYPGRWHNYGLNAAIADGSVKYFRYTPLMSGLPEYIAYWKWE